MLRELMFGTGEQFLYFKCAECKCLQISERPDNMSAYYPNNYYSLKLTKRSIIRQTRMNVKIMLCLYGSEWLFSGSDWWETGAIKSFRDAAARKSSRILDVGCGDGRLIASLADIGFRSVQGVDPFIDSEISYPNGAKVYKRELSEMQGSFDLITMHHCLEHVWDQHGTMRDLLRLLSPEGRCVISIPTIDSWASNEYGVNWVDLDPPRHFYIHKRQRQAPPQ
jgi:2-polyprenyl-3-methyl-5-hydroxy-6-metoxy-1,4-benzoquinol methylase